MSEQEQERHQSDESTEEPDVEAHLQDTFGLQDEAGERELQDEAGERHRLDESL